MLTVMDIKRDWSKLAILLTIGRFAFSCLPAVLLVTYPNDMSWCWAAVVLFIVAASTEFWQGYIAGRLHQVTELGDYLDLAIDRALLMPTLLALCYINPKGMIVATVVVGVYESVIGWLLVYAKMQGMPTPMLRCGKVKTVVLTITISILVIPQPQQVLFMVLTAGMVLLSLIVMTCSLIAYIKKYGHAHTVCQQQTIC